MDERNRQCPKGKGRRHEVPQCGQWRCVEDEKDHDVVEERAKEEKWKGCGQSKVQKEESERMNHCWKVDRSDSKRFEEEDHQAQL